VSLDRDILIHYARLITLNAIIFQSAKMGITLKIGFNLKHSHSFAFFSLLFFFFNFAGQSNKIMISDRLVLGPLLTSRCSNIPIFRDLTSQIKVKPTERYDWTSIVIILNNDMTKRSLIDATNI